MEVRKSNGRARDARGGKSRLSGIFRAIGFRRAEIFLRREELMLKAAILFLLVGVVAALLGFTSIAGASFAIAKIFAFLFLVLFLVFLVIGMSVAKRV